MSMPITAYLRIFNFIKHEQNSWFLNPRYFRNTKCIIEISFMGHSFENALFNTLITFGLRVNTLFFILTSFA